jgi:hypothetical protein
VKTVWVRKLDARAKKPRTPNPVGRRRDPVGERQRKRVSQHRNETLHRERRAGSRRLEPKEPVQVEQDAHQPAMAPVEAG